ncbi:hypothetical protein CR513_17085, partial [Mucuna pruriens]
MKNRRNKYSRERFHANEGKGKGKGKEESETEIRGRRSINIVLATGRRRSSTSLGYAGDFRGGFGRLGRRSRCRRLGSEKALLIWVSTTPVDTFTCCPWPVKFSPQDPSLPEACVLTGLLTVRRSERE